MNKGSEIRIQPTRGGLGFIELLDEHEQRAKKSHRRSQRLLCADWPAHGIPHGTKYWVGKVGKVYPDSKSGDGFSRYTASTPSPLSLRLPTRGVRWVAWH